MHGRKLVALGLASATLLLIGAGAAYADDNDNDNGGDRHGYPSTQSPAQGASAGGATAKNGGKSFSDAAKASAGHKRPQGADGTDTRFVQPDPRFVEGPGGGLVKNGPLE